MTEANEVSSAVPPTRQAVASGGLPAVFAPDPGCRHDCAAFELAKHEGNK